MNNYSTKSNNYTNENKMFEQINNMSLKEVLSNSLKNLIWRASSTLGWALGGGFVFIVIFLLLKALGD